MMKHETIVAVPTVPGEGEAAGHGAYKWYVLSLLVLICITGAIDRE